MPTFTRNGKQLGVWSEIDAESYDEALNVLPPARMWRGGFLLGERYSSTQAGEAVWACYQRHGVNGKYYTCLTTLGALSRHLANLDKEV